MTKTPQDILMSIFLTIPWGQKID
jgi:hypothetical protein